MKEVKSIATSTTFLQLWEHFPEEVCEWCPPLIQVLSFVFPKKPSHFFVLQHWVKGNTIPANLTSSNHKFPAPVICAAIGLEDVEQRVTWKKIVPPVEKRLLWNESWPHLIIYPIYVLVAILKWKQRSSLPSIYITFIDVFLIYVHIDNK